MRRRLLNQGFARGLIGKVGLEVSGIPSSAAKECPASAELREWRTKAKPSSESRRAMAAPMPDVAPVTSAARLF
jgi:hypothetical protein